MQHSIRKTIIIKKVSLAMSEGQKEIKKVFSIRDKSPQSVALCLHHNEK